MPRPGDVRAPQCDLPPPLAPSRFLCDDVDFNLRVHSAGLLLCRFNRFSVMKKQIAVGGHRSFHITAKVRGRGRGRGRGPDALETNFSFHSLRSIL